MIVDRLLLFLCIFYVDLLYQLQPGSSLTGAISYSRCLQAFIFCELLLHNESAGELLMFSNIYSHS